MLSGLLCPVLSPALGHELSTGDHGPIFSGSNGQNLSLYIDNVCLKQHDPCLHKITMSNYLKTKMVLYQFYPGRDFCAV